MFDLLLAVSLSLGAQAPPTCPGDSAPPVAVVPGLTLCATGVETPLDADGETSVRIAALAETHPLARKGMRAGDAIFKIDDVRVRSGAEAATRLRTALDARDALINFRRNDLPLLLRTGRTAER
jgi:hypothetical protein